MSFDCVETVPFNCTQKSLVKYFKIVANSTPQWYDVVA